MDAKNKTEKLVETVNHRKPVGRKSITKKEEPPQEVSGREILQDYVMMKTGSMEKYNQLCAALDTYESWSVESRITFILQFVDCFDIMDANCAELVYKLCKIRWHFLPCTVLHNFVNFLLSLAINHVHHISQVISSFVNHLSPPLIAEENASFSSANGLKSESVDDQLRQESIYGMAHLSIRTLNSCNPLSNRVLLKCCVKQFPHIKQPTPKLLAYIRNLIHLADSTNDEEIVAELWSLIVEKILQIDISTNELQDEEQRLSFCKYTVNYQKEGSSKLISGDEISCEETEDPVNQMEAKLDSLIALLLTYIGGRSPNDIEEGKGNQFVAAFENDPNFKSLRAFGRKNRDLLFKLLLEAFDEHLLGTVNAHSTPFIWFYFCSLSERYCSQMFEFLWAALQSPIDSPNEWRKAHNAAAFLCGFLARANYVDFKLSYHWMRKISCWCREYVEKFSESKLGRRNYGIQHGTFYAVVQSLLFIFCYRHGELQKENVCDEVRSWLQFLVQSPLEPLQWISQGVALCFLSVNRHLRLVHYNQLEGSSQSFSRKRKRTSLELFFPFSFCSLTECSSLILPLMHRFNPITEVSPAISDSDGEESNVTQQRIAGESGKETEADKEKDDNRFGDGHFTAGKEELGNGEVEEQGHSRDNDDTNNNMMVDEGYEEELMSAHIHSSAVNAFGAGFLRDNECLHELME